MFDNLCKSWPRESQQCINRLKNKQTSYRVLNTVLIKVLYDRCGSWPQKCYGDGYSTGWLRHFIATRRYEFFNFRSAEARSGWALSTGPKGFRLRKSWLYSIASTPDIGGLGVLLSSHLCHWLTKKTSFSTSFIFANLHSRVINFARKSDY